MHRDREDITLKKGQTFFKWTNFTISQKYLCNLVLALVFILIAVISATILLQQSLQRVNQASVQGSQAVKITEIGSLFRSKDSKVVDYLLNPGDAAVKTYSAAQLQLTKSEKKVQPYMVTREQKDLFTKIMSDDSKTYNLFQNELVPAVTMNEMKKAAEIRKEQNVIQEDMMKRLESLRVSVLSQESAAMNAARLQIRLSIFFLICSLIFAVLVSGAITYIIQRKISRSFAQVLKMTNRIAEGDLSGEDEPIRGKDEISLIAKSIIGMKNNLVEMTKTIAGHSDVSRKNSRRLTASIRDIAASSSTISASMTELSAGVEDQAKNASRINDMARQFMDDLNREKDRAESINTLSDSAGEATHIGKTAIDASVSQMNQINSSVHDCMQQMDLLDARMENVSKLSGMIEDVASETNLLALNASIESARAGEGGSGFAVIADAIRNLSDQTSQSARKITTMMPEIQSDLENVHQALIICFNQVQEGSEKIQLTGRHFSKIDQLMQQIGKRIKEMSVRLRSVSVIGQNMTRSIETIAAVSEESSATVSDVAHSIGKVSDTVHVFFNDAKSIDSESDKLDRMIRQFKMNESPSA
jgi:Methyl-accepting chemotaxis protein